MVMIVMILISNLKVDPKRKTMNMNLNVKL